jgi:hypothetical protein
MADGDELLALVGDETPCPKRDDGQHCDCWYDGLECCSCGDPAELPEPTAEAKGGPR